MTGRRVLLLGASGFLGSQVGAALDRDPLVAAVTRVRRRRLDAAGAVQVGAGQIATGRAHAAQAISGQAGADGPAGRCISLDLITANADELAALVRGARPDAVISCVGRLSGDAVQLVEANVLLTARLIEAVAREAPSARLVVLGSAAEYGPVPRGHRSAEDDLTSPTSAYGVTRLASTQLVRLARSQGRLDGVVLRVFNPVGPGVPPENLLGRAAARIRAALRDGSDTVVLGPLGAHRDFVDVRDVATAITAAALAERVTEPVLNVGTGRPVLSRDAVSLMATIAGYTGQIMETDPPSHRSGFVDWSAADVSRSERSLGWTSAHDLGASVAAAWDSDELVGAPGAPS
jgi:NDP-hexose 4-ketoreductase